MVLIFLVLPLPLVRVNDIKLAERTLVEPWVQRKIMISMVIFFFVFLRLLFFALLLLYVA